MTITGPLTEPFVVLQEGDRIYPWKVIAGAGLTGGQAVFGDAVILPHTSGPPRHSHTHEDEAAFVLEGVLTVEIGDQRWEAGPGSLVWMPRQYPHAFANLSDEVCRAFGVSVPGTLDGFFQEQLEYLVSLSGPPDPAVLEQIAGRYDITMIGPPLTA